MNQQNEERLGSAPMLPLVLKMALPAMAAQLVNLLYSIVDRIYIGHIPHIGTDALAGVGMTNAIILLISAFSMIVGGGGAPLAAIALGRGDRRRAEKIMGNGFLLLSVFAVLLMSLAYLFRRPLLLLMGARGAVLHYALEYLSWYLSGTFFVLITTGLNPFINTQGRPGIGMGSVVIGAALNIVLDPIFIFAFHLGVAGAAIATVLSQLVGCVWVLGFLGSRKATLRLVPKALKPAGPIVGSILGLGISPFVMASTESLVGFVMNGSLARFGDIYVSALAVLQSAVQLISVPLTGFIQGITPIISYNYGRGNRGRVKAAVKQCMLIVTSVMFAAILLMTYFSRGIAGIFTNNPTLVKVVQRAAPAFLLGMSIFGLQRTCQNTFIALGEAKVSLFIALLRKVILLIPLILLLPHFFGVMGVFGSESVADATAALVCTMIFLFRFPRLLRRPQLQPGENG